MTESIPIKSYKELKGYFDGYPNSSECKYIFRGLSSKYSIIPSLHYKKISNKESFSIYEKNLLENFCMHLSNNLKKQEVNIHNWDMWFLSRHFGLKSRLIDFTKDITVALQFAFEMSSGENINLWALEVDNEEIGLSDDYEKINPFTIEKTTCIKPDLKYASLYEDLLGYRRMFVQSGRFITQPILNSNKSLIEKVSEETCLKFDIDYSLYKIFQKEILEEGTDISKKLLIQEKSDLDNCCSNFNEVLFPK